MAKKLSIPKKIAGVKIPKRLRRSKMLKTLLRNATGRQIVADALMAGATAAAAALVAKTDTAADVANAAVDGAGKVKRRGGNAARRIGTALEDATDAIMGVVGDAARSLVPKKEAGRKNRQAADLH